MPYTLCIALEIKVHHSQPASRALHGKKESPRKIGSVCRRLLQHPPHTRPGHEWDTSEYQTTPGVLREHT